MVFFVSVLEGQNCLALLISVKPSIPVKLCRERVNGNEKKFNQKKVGIEKSNDCQLIVSWKNGLNILTSCHRISFFNVAGFCCIDESVGTSH